ncbi:MATE family efflux transporter [Halobacteriovorax marinus]|nr:polysaccharide biosynthesis protein [Halobacteriovorax marinus]
MFIVLPYLSSNKVIFGIYSLCLSFNIFLSYADLGFIGAGFKYASEAFARKDKEGELEVIGFTTFILLIAVCIFSAVMLMGAFDPSLLISDIGNGSEIDIAKSMFFILSLFSITTVLQRVLQFIYGVRVEDFIVRKINILGHIAKISSVFYFFREGSYNIIGYYLFFQVVNLLCALIGLVVARRIYSLDLKKLVKNIRFSWPVFYKVKSLALTSFIMSALWIAYYEIDSPVIAKFYGANKLAYYAIGLSLLSFLRSIFGILYSPFSARFNHFLGLRDEEGLKRFYYNTIVYLLPMSVFSVLTITILMENIVFTWVGQQYSESIVTAQLLILTFLFAFNNYPAGILLMGKEKNNELRIVNLFIAVAFWLIILLLNNQYDYQSFAISKLIVFSVSTVFYVYFTRDYIFGANKYIKEIIVPMFVGAITTSVVAYYFSLILPVGQSKANLFLVAAACAICCFCGLLSYFVSNSKFRKDIVSTVKETNYFKTSK